MQQTQSESRCPSIYMVMLMVMVTGLTACAGAALPPVPGAADPQGDESAAIEPEYAAAVERIASEARVQRAFRTIEELEPRTMEHLIRLTEIPAPPFMEQARAEHYLALLAEAGADSVFIDEVGNAIGIRRGASAGAGDPLVLSGHLDTVFPEGTDVMVRMRGDTLYAPGVGDDTRGLVVVLTVLRSLEAAGIRTEKDVWFVGTVGEEGLGDLRGVKHLFREGAPAIGAFISVDGAGGGRVVNRALGSRRYRTTFTGPGGHSWGAFGLANPSHALGRAINLFDDAATNFVSTGPRTSYNVGVIGGGTSVNSIPFEAWMEVDMRSVDAGRLMQIDSIFRATAQAALQEHNETRARGAALSLDLDLVGDRPSGAIAPDNPLVQHALASLSYLRFTTSLAISSTDSNVPISLGIPAVTVSGGGEGGNAHSLDEWWLNVEGYRAIQSTLLLVLAHAGLADAAR
ncbi:M20/M25/M40 family metallo-hydrolase [soil metagenome]